MIEYGFTENIDYVTEDKNVRRADGTIMPQTTKEYTLSLDMAKEISMLQRNERGKMARQHFINIEKKWNSPEQVMARALVMANQSMEKFRNQVQLLQAEVKEKDEQIAVIQPKANYVDDALKTTCGTFSLTHLCKLHGKGILSAVKLNKMLEEDGVTKGKGHQPDQRFIDAHIFTYQIPEYGEDYTGFRSRKLELRIHPEAFQALAKEYIPFCINSVMLKKEVDKVAKKAAKKKTKELVDAFIKLKEQLDGLSTTRRENIWNLLGENKLMLIC